MTPFTKAGRFPTLVRPQKPLASRATTQWHRDTLPAFP
eukprot:CAMPEP_0173429666 /NCGR_PEP_ID=MMETSP1357-20121228/8313_1 /TAXON_ID=77926 /ORGANISM="Hemiselmis rufescens, Strain PCC563" /LENGTH=37 /DNA_ID= /DNA_START= /DNA_END= /DNA_ORIENTATION=